jgi:hypothetical protein
MLAVAQRQDNDDVLFVSDGEIPPIVAVVHLTWSGHTETDPRWPLATLFESVDVWIKNGMLEDHKEFDLNCPSGSATHRKE